MRRALASAALVLVLAPGCGSPPPPPPPPAASASRPRPPPPAAPADELAAGVVGELRSARFDLRFPLPDVRGWRVEDARDPWLTATHAASSTALLVRTWRAEDRGSRAACESRARLWRDLPGGPLASVLERRRIDVPAGFDTEVEIGVMGANEPGKPVNGYAVAFGGWSRRCFAFVVTTRAEGPAAERQVGARLAAMVEVSLAGLTLESELAPVLPR